MAAWRGALERSPGQEALGDSPSAYRPSFRGHEGTGGLAEDAAGGKEGWCFNWTSRGSAWIVYQHLSTFYNKSVVGRTLSLFSRVLKLWPDQSHKLQILSLDA